MRIEQLTFTRFLAAVSIVIFHYGGKSFPFNDDKIAFIFRGADVGVSYFFILSGFVMMIAYGNKSVITAKDYFKNRFVRIYPVYFIALVLTLIQQMLTKSVDFNGLFISMCMLQAWVPGKLLSFNPPAWTLSVEFVFYAFFPFIFNRLFGKIELKKLSIGIIIFWIFSQLICQIFFVYYGSSLLGYPVMHINEFLIGNLAGFLFVRNLQEKKANYDFAILILAVLVIVALKFQLGLNFHNGLLAVFFIPLIVLISLNNGLVAKIFLKKPFVFLGEISYGIYILQYPVYSLISAYSINKYFQINDPTIVFYIRLVILIVFSSIVYIYIEKPLLDKIKSRNKIAFSLNPV